MPLFRNQRDALKNSAKRLFALSSSRIAALGSTYLTAAILGSSYLGMTIATSVARHVFEVASSAPRKI
jgi:hypothetical protein